MLRTSVSYLGFQVNVQVYTIKTSYLQKLKEWPQPRSLKGVEGVLGLLSYYRGLIPTLCIRSKHLSELRKTLRTENPFYWGSKEQQEFEDLVGALRKLPVAAFSDWSQGAATFVLQTECK